MVARGQDDKNNRSWIWGEEHTSLLLERLLEKVGQPRDPEEVVRKLRDNHGRNPQERLTRAGDALGLRVEATRGTLEEAIGHLSDQAPVLFYLEGERPGWLLVTERHKASLTVSGPERGSQESIHKEVLHRWLGQPQEITWLEVGAALPMTRMQTSHLRHEAGEPERAEPISPLRRMWALALIEKDDIKTVVVFAVGVGMLTLVTPVAMQALVNTVSFGVLLQPLVVLSALLLGGLTFAAVLRALEVWVVEVLQRRLFLRLVGDVAHRMPRVDYKVFDEHHGPELVNRFFDIFTVKKVGSWILLEGLEIVMTVLIGMLVLGFYHPLLLAFDVLLLLSLLLVLALGKGGAKTAIKESKAKYAVASWLEEMARHPFAFKAIGGPGFGFLRADTLARRYLHARSKHFKVVMRQIIGTLTIQALATTGLVAVGGWLVINQQLTLGQLVAAELIVSVVVASLLKLSRYLENVYDMIAAIDKVGTLVDLPLEREDGQWLSSCEDTRGTSLRLRSLSFGFSRSNPLLDKVDLEIKPGQRVVLTGKSGSGKSAILDLIFGIRDPWSGAVEIGGEDIRELRLASLRERVAVVRHPEIFEGTVLENLTLGRAQISIAQIEEALAAVGLRDVVARLPEGMHTPLTSGGPQLSTSQAVRLTIARALIARPRFLAIDDVFSRFSGEVMQQVLGALTDPEAPWTLLIVTHDPRIQGFCGRTLHLEDGKLREEEPTC